MAGDHRNLFGFISVGLVFDCCDGSVFSIRTSREFQTAGKEYRVLVVHLCRGVFHIPEQTVWYIADVYVPDDTAFVLL